MEGLTAIPGAPKGKPKLELIAGGEVLAVRADQLAVRATDAYEPTEAELASVVRGLEEIGADSFDPPLTFESLVRDGDALRLIVNGDAVIVPWSGGWTKLADVEEELMGALHRYRRGRSS